MKQHRYDHAFRSNSTMIAFLRIPSNYNHPLFHKTNCLSDKECITEDSYIFSMTSPLNASIKWEKYLTCQSCYFRHFLSHQMKCDLVAHDKSLSKYVHFSSSFFLYPYFYKHHKLIVYILIVNHHKILNIKNLTARFCSHLNY